MAAGRGPRYSDNILARICEYTSIAVRILTVAAISEAAGRGARGARRAEDGGAAGADGVMLTSAIGATTTAAAAAAAATKTTLVGAAMWMTW